VELETSGEARDMGNRGKHSRKASLEDMWAVREYESMAGRANDERLIALRADGTPFINRWRRGGAPNDAEVSAYARKCRAYLEFARAIERACKKTAGRYENVLVRPDTPSSLVELGMGNYPMFQTKCHIRNELHPLDDDPAHHGLEKSSLVRLPEKLECPCAVFRSARDPRRLVCVIEELDIMERPVIAIMRPNVAESQTGKACNFILSVYGKDKFEGFVERAARAGNVLFIDVEKTRNLMSCAGLRLPEACMRLGETIPQSSQKVNREKAGKPKAARNIPAPAVKTRSASPKEDRARLAGGSRADVGGRGCRMQKAAAAR